jgi:hypothetical protein
MEIKYLYTSLCLLLILAGNLVGQDNHERWVHEQNIPGWVKSVFSQKNLEKKYAFSYVLNPFYLRGDFNGDGATDVAILVEEVRTGKRGIAVCHGGKKQVFFLGAGSKCGNGGDDFTWLDVWSVYPRGPVSQGAGEPDVPRLLGEALHVEKSGSASGLIYWNGQQYLWYQQGD